MFDRALAAHPLGAPAKFDDAVRENALLLVPPAAQHRMNNETKFSEATAQSKLNNKLNNLAAKIKSF